MSAEKIYTRPADPQAERAVLAAVLLTPSVERNDKCSNTTLARLAAIVAARDFDDPRYALLWEVFLALDGQGKPVDVVTVCAALRARDRLSTVGGAQSIGELTDEIPTVAHAPAHAQIVADLAALRRLTEGVDAARVALGVREDGVRGALARGHALLGTLTERRQVRGTSARDHAKAARQRVLSAREARGNGTLVAARFGLECLDGARDGSHAGLLGGILAGRVVTLSAPPGLGKTTLASQAAITTACDGGRVLWFSTEIPGDEVAIRYACQTSEPPLSQVDALAGCLNDDELLQLEHGFQAFERLPIHIYTDDLSVDAIYATVAAECAATPDQVRLVVLDYFQDLDATGKETETAEQKYRAKRTKDLARNLRVGILAVSSINKEGQRARELGGRASTANLHGAGINYASDIVIEMSFVKPDDGTDPGDADVVRVELTLTKVRYGKAGRPTVEFDKPRGAFRDPVFTREGAQMEDL